MKYFVEVPKYIPKHILKSIQLKTASENKKRKRYTYQIINKLDLIQHIVRRKTFSQFIPKAKSTLYYCLS